MMTFFPRLMLFVLFFTVTRSDVRAAGPMVPDVTAKLRQAAGYYHDRVATHGGYVYHYSLDLKQRWGEGVASPDQIWVQPPGTPTVGMAFLRAWQATGDRFYLTAAQEAAEALIYGQLASGGWANRIDFNPRGDGVSQYRNGRGKGRNYSTLDDGITQAALRFLMRMDQALEFKNETVHEAAQFALNALLKAQYPNGGFPQVWSGPVPQRPVVKARYFEGDWKKDNRVKEYWNEYTLNDDLAGSVSETLLEAWSIYQDERCRRSLVQLGEFLLLAQMPQPQPAWAQQYNERMEPIWARKFEPPAISGRESQDALETLLRIYRLTKDERYLEPFPSALAWLKKSRLPDGRLARYYELRSNRPLYMNQNYELTYDDSQTPDHYGWKTESRLEAIEAGWQAAQRGDVPVPPAATDQDVSRVLTELDAEGRWVSTHNGERLVGQPKIARGAKYLSSEVFSRNVELLSDWLQARSMK